MDRSKRSLARPTWVGLGLALASANFGCTQLKSQLWGEARPSAELGQVMDTHDAYAQGHRTRSTTATAPAPIRVGTEGLAYPMTQVDEVGAASPPAEMPDPSPAGVALQPPATLDVRTTSRASLGVPNASRLLASAERRPLVAPGKTPAQVVAEARAALDGMANYQVAMHRQERVNGSLLPEEDVVLAIRREPRAVRLSWTDGPNQGREVLYRADDPDGKMQIKMANPALPRLSLAPDNPLVMRNSRHPVTEAGFDSLVGGLELALNAPSNGELSVAGAETAEGLEGPRTCLTRKAPSGETWKVYLDPLTHLPSLVLAVDVKGELLERYQFRDIRANLPELANAEAFDADARWGQPRGLFGRVAKGESTEPPASPR